MAASAGGFAVLVVTDDHAPADAGAGKATQPPRPVETGPQWQGQIAVAVAPEGADPTLVEVATPERRTPAVVYRAPSGKAIRDLAWSPDGARLAVVVGSPIGSGHVLVIEATSDHITAVTSDRAVTSTSVAWSPDGRRLAYDMGRSAHPERGTPIVVSRADGSHRHVISPPHEYAVAPSWSPDGRRIAYVSAPAPGDFADRTGVVELISAAGGAPRKISGGYDGHNPVWSPEGRAVFFASSWQGGQGFAEVATRPGSKVFLAFDCSRTLGCDTVGRPTFAPGDDALGFIATVDHPPRSLVSVARRGATADSAPILRFPLYTCCLTWWTPLPGQSSV